MTEKDRVKLRELEIVAEGRYFSNSGGRKWNYYGDVIACMTAAEERQYYRLKEIAEQAKPVMV